MLFCMHYLLYVTPTSGLRLGFVIYSTDIDQLSTRLSFDLETVLCHV